MSSSSRIKHAVRRSARESRQARERREAQAWRQRWLAYAEVHGKFHWGRVEAPRARFQPTSQIFGFGGVTVHFEFERAPIVGSVFRARALA